ncbi:MAG: metallophosphoesterase family protein [Sandaracinaceae bacterium]|nr:metallophosphoesterase family protein [Sandaracinaceae bacterium]
MRLLSARALTFASLVALTLSLSGPQARAQALHVQPYVQDVTPSSAWILWETTSGEESRLEWGPTDALGETATGSAIAIEGDARVHEVELTGLSPATRYHYRVHTGTVASDTFFFTTPPARDAETSARIVFVSDMQRDSANPDVYRRIMHDGVATFLAGEGEIDRALDLVVVPGDLVDNGTIYESWQSEFFEPGAELMRHVPFYPTIGNHERNAHYYYDYFHLPDSGAEGTERERWWRVDHGNVRILGLDSNLYVLLGAQEAFLDAELASACVDDTIDFVFVALHHANVSELWPVGEAPLAVSVAERMERFGRDCDRPTAQFYGHTHGYSRGASRDAAHLWVNVASAGGNIDYWGEYGNQYDSPDVSVSQDEWGFVVVDVTAGADPTLRLRRVSLGNERTARANEIRDEIVIRRHDEAPSAPSPRMPRGRVTAACATMAASDFVDPDGDLHGASQWQLAERCDDFDAPLADRMRWFENWYEGADTQAGDDLSDEPLVLEGEAPLAEGDYRCWRVRYRDRGLAWSPWSEPVAFQIDASGATPAMGCDDPTMLTPPPRPDAAVDPDASVTAPDASRDDAGAGTGSGGGCGCRAASHDRARGAWVLGGLAFLGLLGRRRRGPTLRRPR